VIHPAQIENAMVNYIVLSIALIFEVGTWDFIFKGFGQVKGKSGIYPGRSTS